MNLSNTTFLTSASARLAGPLLLGSPKLPSAPASLSVSPSARPVLPWVLAALGAELSPDSLSVPSSWQTCYPSSRVDLLILRDCTASALITGSLTRSVIGDRPSPSKTLGSGDARLKSDRVSEALQALDQVSFQALCVESVKVIAAEICVGATRPL